MSAEERLVLMPARDAAVAAERAFTPLRDRLAAVLPQDADIEHVGATAVLDCDTKGDLNIAVRVAPEDFAAAEVALAGLLERNLGSDRTESFAAFKDDGARPPLGVQLVVRGSPFDAFVRFRDLLRADPSLVARYNALKRKRDGTDMDEYRAAQSAFIEAALAGTAGLFGSEEASVADQP